MATIACHYVQAALGGAVRHGLDANELLVKSGINPRVFATPLCRVSDSQMTRLVQRIWWALSDEFMGFTAQPSRLGLFPLVVEATSGAESLREVLDWGMRMYNLINEGIHTQLFEVDNHAHLLTHFARPELDPQHFFSEFWLVIWHRFSSWLIGRKIPLTHVCLAYPKPAHAAELSYLFPCTKEYDCDYNQLTFDSHYLNMKPLRSKQEILQFSRHAPAGLMTIPGDDQSLQNKISRMIYEQKAAILSLPRIEDVADHFHMTTQTLHRRLRKEGTSYQRIKNNIRRDIAVTKLVKERLPVYQVAEIVGFSEPRSFTRAFKQWTGLSPREYCRYV